MVEQKRYDIKTLFARAHKIWPVPQYGPKTQSQRRMKGFGAGRPAGKKPPVRHHFGVDIAYMRYKPDVKVVAIEDGTVLASQRFYQGTYALFIKNKSGHIVNYGEISKPNLSKGDEVIAGEIIGEIGKRNNLKTSVNSMMLHLELWTDIPTLKSNPNRVARGTIKWPWKQKNPPTNLKDPLPYLEQCTHYTLNDCKKIVQNTKNRSSQSRGFKDHESEQEYISNQMKLSPPIQK